MSCSDLPSFDRPPVIETVLGVQFGLIEGLTNAHLGAFWSTLSSDWPHVTDAPPLDQQFEQFDEERAWAQVGARLKLTQDPSARLRIHNAARDSMIQVQNGRFHYNWLGKTGEAYPQYTTVRPEFDKWFAAFRASIQHQGLAAIKVNQWEVTYVNHLPKGSVWNEPCDWAPLFPGLPAPNPGLSGATLESVAGEWHYQIPDRRGRLHVQIGHGRRDVPEKNEVLILNLTARGPVNGSEECEAPWDAGLNLGREVIVRAFKELTSATAHKYWGLKDA